MFKPAEMKRTLTFVPGTMCDRRVWDPVWNALQDGFGFDYIPIETARNRQDVRALFETARNGEEKLNLIAFSMGGYMAIEFALRHPERVNTLTTVSSSAFGLHDEEKRQRLATIRFLETANYVGVTDRRLNQMLHPDHRRDEHIKGIMRAMDRDLGRDVLIAQLRETSDRVDLGPRLPELTCPVHLIGADADPFLTPAQLAAMQRAIPDARASLAKDSGHMVPLERPDWLAGVIRTFFSEI